MIEATVRLRSGFAQEANLSPPELPQHLGDYRILREIGRGGMGVVYEAEQISLHRRVALKVLSDGHSFDPRAVALFQREARSAARLHHSNIVPVFEVGEQGGVSYYAMQFILGCSLEALITSLSGNAPLELTSPRSADAFKLSPELQSCAHPEHFRGLADLALQVSCGLAYAHARGVIHRDIKPANLLVDSDGDVWITDFGLAKHASDNATQDGHIFGTLGYMAPERFKGSGDARSDVYALGCTLYELTTRQQAFPLMTGPADLERLAADPRPPRAIEPRLPRDLETIILKAMDKDPARRYPSADELADDLRRFIADEPIRAKPIGVIARTSRWARRKPALASLLGAVVVLTATVMIGALVAAISFHGLADQERKLRVTAELAQSAALTERDRADDARKRATEANQAAQDISTFLLGILDEADPLAPSGRLFGGQPTNRSGPMPTGKMLDRALAKLDGAPDIAPKVRATLLDKIGTIYVSLGDFQHAGPVLEKALGLRRAEHGEESLESAATWHNLGYFHLGQRSFEPAEDAYRRAYDIRAKELGPDSKEATSTLLHLGFLKAFDFPDEAAVMLEKAVANQRKLFGPESREYGMGLVVLAFTLSNQGKFHDAAVLMPEALRLMQQHEDSRELVKALEEFMEGRLASQVGLHAQASKNYCASLLRVEKRLGESHFIVLLGRGQLAVHYHENVKDLTAAEKEYRKLQTLCHATYGIHSPQAASTQMFLARVLRDQKRYGEAENMLEEAAKVLRTRKAAPYGRCMHVLAEVRQKQGKFEEAVPALREAIQGRMKDGDLTWLGIAADQMADQLVKLRRPTEAVDALRQANVHLAQQKSLTPADHWYIACRSAHQCRLVKEQTPASAEQVQIALASLQVVLTTKHKTANDLRQDSALDPLRAEPAFRQMLTNAGK